MKQATAALSGYLSTNNNAVLSDLYTIQTVGSGTYRFNEGGPPSITLPAANMPGCLLNFNSGSGNQTFTRGPRFGRSKITTKIGIEPAEMDLDIYATTSDLIGNLTYQEFALAGGFDFAIIELDRFFMPTGGDGVTGPLNTSLGAIIWFYGLVNDIDISRGGLKLKVQAATTLLKEQEMPRRLFQSGCTHIFGDPMCGYDRVNGKNALGVSTGLGQVTITALAGTTAMSLVTSFSPTPSTAYNQGTVIGLTGANAGLIRTSNSVTAGTVALSRPFPFTPSVGDTFYIRPGCDHTAATCNSTFQNILRYGGFDYIPPPEMSV